MRLRIAFLFLAGAALSRAEPPPVNLHAIDATLSAVAKHAANYPPHFSSKAERRRMEGQLRGAIQRLDAAAASHPGDPAILLRDGFANALGTNLDFKGCAGRSSTAYQRLLRLRPDSKAGNFQYGAFLGNTDHPRESIRYLQKAADLGVSEAHWGLALSYIMLKDRADAIHEMRRYLAFHPKNGQAKNLLAAFESNDLKIETKEVKSPDQAPNGVTPRKPGGR